MTAGMGQTGLASGIPIREVHTDTHSLWFKVQAQVYQVPIPRLSWQH